MMLKTDNMLYISSLNETPLRTQLMSLSDLSDETKIIIMMLFCLHIECSVNC